MDSAAGAAAFWKGVEEAAAATSAASGSAPQTERVRAAGHRPGHARRRAGQGRRRSSPRRPRRRARPCFASCRRRRRPPRRRRRSPSTSTRPAGRRARRTYVAGASLTVHDFVDAIYSRFPWIIAFVVGVTGLVLFAHAAQRRAAGEGGDHERLLSAGRLRGDGLDLPGGPPRGALPVHGDRRDRRRAAGGAVLHRVRRLHGLRGLPALAHARGVGRDPRQHPRGELRARAAPAASSRARR